MTSHILVVQTHALADVCFTKGLWTVDEMRRGIEGLPEAAYRCAKYGVKHSPMYMMQDITVCHQGRICAHSSAQLS